ncbi:MAG: hypothetical protein NC911_02620 [Candidatus Omnitrophica bacterium]|nr:hypothetical protein [Candidatus Omnitrophota bacterium]MCM8768564.1 hypothetical protein [Candidatus Omnitrophota bacterium]
MARLKKRRDSIDERIRKLEEEMDLTITGAPDTYKIDEPQSAPSPAQVIPEKREPVVPVNYSGESGPPFFRRRSFWIIAGVLILVILVLFFAPVLQFSTPVRPDNDLPGVKISFRYYYNIFGQKQKEETLVFIDHTKVVILLPMHQWMNLEKEKKLMAIKHYQDQD